MAFRKLPKRKWAAGDPAAPRPPPRCSNFPAGRGPPSAGQCRHPCKEAPTIVVSVSQARRTQGQNQRAGGLSGWVRCPLSGPHRFLMGQAPRFPTPVCPANKAFFLMGETDSSVRLPPTAPILPKPRFSTGRPRYCTSLLQELVRMRSLTRPRPVGSMAVDGAVIQVDQARGGPWGCSV